MFLIYGIQFDILRILEIIQKTIRNALMELRRLKFEASPSY